MDKNNFFGFIRDKLDIQILLLYILDRLPAPVDDVVLADLALFDGGFTWFEYAESLASLVQTGHVTEENGKYEITEKGRRNVGYVGSSLPYSVRSKADRLTAPVAARLRRENQIETSSETNEDGSCTVSLRLSDGVGEVIALRLAVPDEKSAAEIEGKFKKQAEKIYNSILGLFAGE